MGSPTFVELTLPASSTDVSEAIHLVCEAATDLVADSWKRAGTRALVRTLSEFPAKSWDPVASVERIQKGNRSELVLRVRMNPNVEAFLNRLKEAALKVSQ